MPDNEYDKYLLDTFKNFFGSWRNNIESYEHACDHAIKIKMKKGDFFNSGFVYIFGDHGCDDWHLEQIKKKGE